MNKVILAAVLSVGIAVPAHAQESSSFQGFKVEALGGVDHVTGEADDDASKTGGLFGVGIGYDYAFGAVTLGVEGELTSSTVKECVDDIFVANDRGCLGAGEDLYAGVRVGGEFTPGALAYLKVGYSLAKTSLDYEGTLPAGIDSNDIEDFAPDLEGFRIGAGLERTIGTNLFVKAEYRYTNYELDTVRHQGVVGLGYRF